MILAVLEHLLVMVGGAIGDSIGIDINIEKAILLCTQM